MVKLGPLDDLHARQPGDLRAVAPVGGRKDDGDLLAVASREFLDHYFHERAIAADNEMIAARRHRGVRSHGAILARLGRRGQDNRARTPKIPASDVAGSCGAGPF